jgi:hypothetical protein
LPALAGFIAFKKSAIHAEEDIVAGAIKHAITAVASAFDRMAKATPVKVHKKPLG